MLSNDQRRNGCALVNIGADTTTISIYNNNHQRKLTILPFGGNNITRDICSQQIEEEDAEALKLRFAQAYIEPKENEDENKTYNLDGRCSINAILLEDIVEARLNEILDNVAHQIAISGYENKLLAGAIITGGATNMMNMEEAFIKRTKMEKLRVAKDTHITLKGLEIKKDGSNNTLIALLAAGKENCCLIMPEQPKVEPVKRLVNTQAIEQDIFIQAEKEEEERKRQQEKEAILAQQKAEKEAMKAAAEAQKAAEEAEKQKKADCEELIQEAVRMKNNEKYSDTLKKLKKAASMNIAEKAEAIKTIKNEIEELKNKNSFASRIGNWINTILDENN